MVRLQPSLLSGLDSWIAEQAGSPTRPEAVRRLPSAPSVPSLLRRALAARARPKLPGMASHEINKLGDKSATDEERATGNGD